jgi:hypothetical protein
LVRLNQATMHHSFWNTQPALRCHPRLPGGGAFMRPDCALL